MPDVPVMMSALGIMDMDYRIMVAGRNGKIYVIKNGKLSSNVIAVEAAPVGLVCLSSREIFVGVTGKTLHSFHMKGKKNYTMQMPADIKVMSLFMKNDSEKYRAHRGRNRATRYTKKDKTLRGASGQGATGCSDDASNLSARPVQAAPLICENVRKAHRQWD